jgi:hypothetical protein
LKGEFVLEKSKKAHSFSKFNIKLEKNLMSNEEEYSVRHDIVKTDRKGNSTDKDKVKNKHTKNHNNMSIPVNLPDCEKQIKACTSRFFN